MTNSNEIDVLCLGCFGMGHYNPTLQVARAAAATIKAANKKPRITMIVPTTYEIIQRVVSSDEMESVKINSWYRRIIDSGDIEQCFYTVPPMAPGINLLLMQINLQPEWKIFIEELYEERKTQPALILSDMIIFIDIKLAEKWQCKSYTFFPSPITCHYIIPHMARIWHDSSDLDSSEPSTDATSSEGPEAPILTFPGMPGIELDMKFESLQELADEGDKEAGVKAMKEFIKIQLETSQARNGIVCNDVSGFYPPKFLEHCKMHPEYEVLLVGPLASHFEKRPSSTGEIIDPVIGWLDSKPAKSVVFISMGSQFDLPPSTILLLTRAFSALFESNETINILWAHRALKNIDSITEYDSDEVGLPKGWLEAHSDRVKMSSWVDQPKCLAHKSIGLFMTHAGWNGLIEAFAVGHAPLLLCPVNAEQPANAKFMEAYYRVGERLWRNIKESCDINENTIINKITNCLNNEEYTRNLNRMCETARSAWNSESGSSKTNLKLAFRTILD